MIRDEELRVDIGRCVGGSFIQVTHIPTGISRKKGPLDGESSHSVQRRFVKEIEQELVSNGLTQYVVADYRKRDREVS